MIVCHCRKVTDKALLEAMAAGAVTEAEIGRQTGAGTCCGGCRPAIAELLTAHGPKISLVILPMVDAG